MKALLKFNGAGASELQEEPEAKDEQTEVHDILFNQLKLLASLAPEDNNLQKKVILARAIAEMSEQIIKHGMYAVAISKLADSAVANTRLPKFILK